MVCSKKCGCSAFCRRFLCREKESDKKSESVNKEDGIQLEDREHVVFTQLLTTPLTPGSHIVFTGTPNDDHERFTINIGTGDPDSPNGDIATHFDVRMPQHYVVRNSRKGNRWYDEETTSFRKFPFATGRPFTIEALIDDYQTLYAVDGQHYCSFTHRSPTPAECSWVQVSGVRDAALSVQATVRYPLLALPTPAVPIRETKESLADSNEPTWYPHVICKLSNGIPEGFQLVLQGRLRPLLDTFTLDLSDTENEWPHPAIPLHVSVRAMDRPHLSRQLVVLNSWSNGGWGSERRQRTAQLVPGTKTTFTIFRGPAEWALAADNMVIGELEFRLSPNIVKALRVRGDFYPEAIYLCPLNSMPQRADSEPFQAVLADIMNLK